MNGQIPTANPPNKENKLKAVALLEIGLAEIFLVIFILLLFFGTLNYFGILPISQTFPFLSFLPSQQKISENKPPANVAAVVNGSSITKEDFNKNLQANQQFYNKVYPEKSGTQISDEFAKGLPKLILEGLIQEKLLTQHLASKGIAISDQQVKDYLQKEIVNPLYGGNLQSYENFLVASGTNLEIASGNIKRNLLRQKVIEVENLNPEDFGRWYAKLKANSKIDTGEDATK